jgi:hypothetical protein
MSKEMRPRRIVDRFFISFDLFLLIVRFRQLSLFVLRLFKFFAERSAKIAIKSSETRRALVRKSRTPDKVPSPLECP